MRRFSSIALLLGILFFLNNNIQAQYLSQQFTGTLTAGNTGSGTTVSNASITSDPVYVNNPASNSQFTFLSTNNALASISMSGDGVMRLVRTGSGTVYVVRNTDFTGAPNALKVSFDFNAEVTAGTSGGVLEFMIGQNFANSNNNPATTDKHSVFFVNTKNPTGTPGTWGVTPLSASSTSAFTTTETITWYINNSGSPITYIGPDGSSNTVVDDSYDLWVGLTKYYGDQAATSATALLNHFEIRIAGGNGSYTIDNLLIDDIPPMGTPPTVTTAAITDITQISASGGGNVTDEGTASVTVRGVCWSLNENPTILDSKTEDGSGPGSFTSAITGLTAGTTYYVRAYAISSAGISYGSQETFATLSGVAGIVLSSDNPAVPAADITAGTLKNPVYKFNLAVSITSTQLNQVDFTTAGTYTSSDVSKLQLWFNTADNFGSAVHIGTDITTIPGGVSNLSFGSLTQNINAGETAYLWITADVSGTATAGNNLSIDAVITGGLTFSSGNKSGTAFNGGLQTIIAAINPDVYFRTKATGDWHTTSTWETSLDSVTWVDAALTPSSLSKYIHVRAPHIVTVTATVSVDQVIVDEGSGIIVNGSPVIFSIIDGPDEIDMLVNGLLKSTGIANASPGPHTVDAVGIVQFGSSGVYEHGQNAGAIPVSVWGTGSTAKITGATSTAPANRNQDYYNLIFDCPAQTANLNMGFNHNTISGNITIVSTNTGRWQLCGPAVDSSATLTILGDVIHLGGNFSTHGTGNANTTIVINHYGNINATNGNFSIARGSQAGTGTTRWYMHNGNISFTNLTTQNSNASGARFVFAGTNVQHITISGVTFTGGGSPVEVASGSTLDVGTSEFGSSGAFTVSANATLFCGNVAGLDSTLKTTGVITLSSDANYGFNGVAAQVTGVKLPTIVKALIIDNANGVTLTSITSCNVLNLTEGKLNTGSSNLLTVSGTTPASIVGGSETDYVNGPLAITLPSSLTAGSIYNFPIGKGSYKPLALVDAVTNASGSAVISSEVFDENSGGTPGTGLTSLNTNRYWSAEVVSGATEFVSTKIRLTENGLTSTMGIGKSSTLSGAYDLISSTQPSGGTITSDDVTSLSYFVIGETSSTSTFQLTVTVTDGWNMVSVPGLHPTNQNVSTWWTNRNPLADVYKWTTTYVAVTTTAPTEGYWMLHNGAQTYNTGDEWPAGGIQFVTHNPIPVNAGWNMIGGYENSASVAGLTTTPPGLIVPGTTYGWNGTYYNPTNLEPGYGYWILLTGAGVINPPTLAASPKEVVQDDKSEWGRIIITDATGKNFTLYSVNGEVNLNQYQMPPSPPTGSFDVRYSSGRKAEDLKSGSQPIEMRGLVYPVTVRIENADIKLQDETGKTVNALMKSGDVITINNEAVAKLIVSQNIIPDVYSLEQNYPNPFNPSTTIAFSLPEDAVNVSLTIYNMLGERVAEIFNGGLVAGSYKYQWDAGKYASGLYMYELRTEKYSAIKKMLMVK